MNSKHLKMLPVLALILIVIRGAARDFEAGTHGGIALNYGGDRFRESGIFGRMNLPGRWNFYSDWMLQPRLEALADCLNDGNLDAFVGAVGPILELHKGAFPVTLEGGVRPTVLSRYCFRDRNFGDDFQFTSHLGLNWDITRHFSIGWEFQHMSNAGIASPNPGLNMQIVSASYHF